MPAQQLKDLNDPRLDLFLRLTERQLRNTLEPEKGIFIAESEKVIRVACAHGLEPVAFLLAERWLDRLDDLLEGLSGDVAVFVLPDEEVEKITGFNVTRGALCAMRRPRPTPPADLIRDARRVCVLEGIVDATNVGAIFRSAAALGVDAVLLDPTCSDPLCRRSVRVSMGNVFLVPWARFDGGGGAAWPASGLADLRGAGFTTCALALTDDSLSLDSPELVGIDRLAMVFGTEGDGLRHETIRGCDLTVRIPMANGVDSLNVAAASAVAFWQLCREA